MELNDLLDRVYGAALASAIVTMATILRLFWEGALADSRDLDIATREERPHQWNSISGGLIVGFVGLRTLLELTAPLLPETFIASARVSTTVIIPWLLLQRAILDNAGVSRGETTATRVVKDDSTVVVAPHLTPLQALLDDFARWVRFLWRASWKAPQTPSEDAESASVASAHKRRAIALLRLSMVSFPIAWLSALGVGLARFDTDFDRIYFRLLFAASSVIAAFGIWFLIIVRSQDPARNALSDSRYANVQDIAVCALVGLLALCDALSPAPSFDNELAIARAGLIVALLVLTLTVEIGRAVTNFSEIMYRIFSETVTNSPIHFLRMASHRIHNLVATPEFVIHELNLLFAKGQSQLADLDENEFQFYARRLRTAERSIAALHSWQSDLRAQAEGRRFVRSQNRWENLHDLAERIRLAALSMRDRRPGVAEIEDFQFNLAAIIGNQNFGSPEEDTSTGEFRRILGAVEVKVPPASFEDALLNLVSNALDAIALQYARFGSTRDQKPTLKVEFLIDPNGPFPVSIAVSDNGPGIPELEQRRIFAPYFSTKADEGRGLGLFMARRIVQSCGGRILLESRTESTDHGSRFSVELPAEVVRINKTLTESVAQS